MSLNVEKTRALLKNFNFKKLFIEELGWNMPKFLQLTFSVKGAENYPGLDIVAEKSGLTVFRYDQIPNYAERRKLDRMASETSREHLIIFCDQPYGRQIWQWVQREPGRALVREYEYNTRQTGEALIQKLDALFISLSEEEAGPTIADIAEKVKKGFDVETVTTKFYKHFQKEHETFLDSIQGINLETDRAWYASLMLNRLMFIYFIQRKGFLDGKRDYLREKLAQVQKLYGQDEFFSFYRHFLLRLFHDGLGSQQRAPELDQLLGRVPYLNGGLFEVHRLEAQNDQIAIPDEAFVRVFDFFDAYQWHLDERPLLLRKDDEINPDVLGYIFEKYINQKEKGQKEKGAYYTKEDITGYISKNTIIPFLFDATRQAYPEAFVPNSPVWQLLASDPDNYIYPATRKGVGKGLPVGIALGRQNVHKRTNWNKPATPDVGLPTEIWRDVVARFARYEEISAKLSAAEVSSINDLITYNLDIRQFAQDVIQQTTDPELLLTFYKNLEKVTVLDPTCGSGAFLLAALNILEPLYDACLARMQYFVEAASQTNSKTLKYPDFQKTLEAVARHPNRNYFIYKAIIINNLFGVDIMEEATEIAKLRLFLKLAAQVTPDPQAKNFGLEPLPDIDFNIQAGNTLVGFASYAEFEKSVSGVTMGKAVQVHFLLDDTAEQVKQKAKAVERSYRDFRDLQTRLDVDHATLVAAKAELRAGLDELRPTLDRYLASAPEYGISQGTAKDAATYQKRFEKWRKSHQPFHWFIEFYSIIQEGGFDVIIGNPPYVEYSKVKSEYTIKGYQTESSGNLYAFILERCLKLDKNNCRLGLIVPLSVICTDRTNSLQDLLKADGFSWYANFDTIPGRLFGKDVEQRLSVLLHCGNSESNIYTTQYQRFVPKQRDHLFDLLEYQLVNQFYRVGWIPRVSSNEAVGILTKLGYKRLSDFEITGQVNPIYIHRIIGYYTKAFDFIPHFRNELYGLKKSEDYKEFFFSESYRKAILATVNSGFFYWYWHSHSDGFHCGYRDVRMLPINFTQMESSLVAELNYLSDKLMKSLNDNSEIKIRNFKKTGRAELQEFDVAKSKSILDEIDKVLAEYYGFTPEELDFIINYDIKYREGGDSIYQND